MGESRAACNCAVQLWLVPFDKTDLAIKEGFDRERIRGYESVSDTKARSVASSSSFVFLLFSISPSSSLVILRSAIHSEMFSAQIV